MKHKILLRPSPVYKILLIKQATWVIEYASKHYNKYHCDKKYLSVIIMAQSVTDIKRQI